MESRPAPGADGGAAQGVAPGPRSGFTRARAGLLLAVLVVAALAARCWAPYPAVFARPGEPRLLGTDPYFHLRQARRAIGGLPRTEGPDAGTHYPQGADDGGAGLFDLAIAGLARLAHGADAGRGDIAAIAAWLPPILGAATLVLLWALARRLGPPAVAPLAGLLFLLYPGESLGRTALGFADHHAAESFLTVGAVLTVVGLLQGVRGGGAGARWRPALLAAAPMTALAWTWRGAPLILLLLAAGMLLERLVVLGGAFARDLARPVVRYGLGLLVPLAAAHWLWPALEVEAPSARLMLVGAVALTAVGGLGLGLLELAALRSRRPVAVAWAGFAVAAAASVLVLVSTPFGRRVWAWLAEARTALVQEHRPVTLGLLIGQLGAVVLLGVAGLALGAIDMARRRLRREWTVPLTVGAGLLAVWCTTRDLGYAPPPFLALAAALPPLAVWRWMGAPAGGRRPAGRGLRAAATGALLLALAAPLWPYGVTRPPWMRPGEVAEARVYTEPLFAAMQWLRERTPPLERGRYGVRSSWPLGNLVASYGERVPVWSRAPDPDYPRWALAQGEAAARLWLCPRCGRADRVRYVVVDARDCGAWLLAAAAQLPESLPLLVAGDGPAAPGVPSVVPGPAWERSLVSRLCADDGGGLETYRLVWESRERRLTGVLVPRVGAGAHRAWARLVTRAAPEGPVSGPVAASDGLVQGARVGAAVKIFEVVRGARLIGSAPPGATVSASLPLAVASSGRRWTYSTATTASGAGAFVLVVPYPTRPEPWHSAVRPTGSYRVEARGAAGRVLSATAEVAVPEVRRGGSVRVELPAPETGDRDAAPVEDEPQGADRPIAVD